MEEKCRRMASEKLHAFKIESQKLNRGAARDGAFGSSRHQILRLELRKHTLKTAIEEMSELVLTHYGKASSRGQNDIKIGAELLRENLISDYESELFANSAFPGGMGPENQREAVGKFRKELDRIVEDGLKDANSGISGNKKILPPKSGLWRRLAEAITANILASGIISILATILGLFIIQFIIKLFRP